MKKVNLQAMSPKQGSLLIVVILALLGGIAWVTITDKEEYLIQRNFRVLNLWSQETIAKIGSYQKGFEIAAVSVTGSASIKIPDENNQERIRDLTRPKDQPLETNTYSMECSVHGTKEFFHALRKELCALDGVTDITVAIDEKDHGNSESKQPVTGKQFDSPSILINSTMHNGTDKHVGITGTVDLKNFLTRLTAKSPFEEVLIFQSAQDGHSSRIFHAGVREFSWRHFEEITKRSEPSSLLDNIFGSQEDSPKNKTDSSYQPGPNHFHFDVPGNTYEVFSYPFAIPGNTKMAWVLVGLISHDAFQRSYLTISSTILLGMILVVLALVLGFPLFYLQMMGPTDPLRSTHVLASALSALLGAALLTYLSLDIFLYSEVKQTLKEEMVTSAQSIKDGLKKELEHILQTLQAFDESNQLKDDIQIIEPLSQRPPAINKVGQRTVLRESDMKNPCAPPGLMLTHLCYPNFIYAFWMDQDASLRINWAREGHDGLGSNISLKDREYTRTVLNHPRDLWRYPRPSAEGGGDYRFFLEPITSWNTGENTVVASMPSHLMQGKQHWVAAMEFTFHSLMDHVVLPPGIGFAVLDNTKDDTKHEVLFHSEEDRNRGENFLVETDHNATLRDLVAAKTAGHADGSYWGQSTSFYVLPLDPMPWSLVVYRNKSMLRSINLMGILIAGTLYGLWSVVLYFIVWLLLKGLTSRQKNTWLWPTRSHHRAYLRLLISNCVLFGLGTIGLYIFSESSTRQLMLTLCVIPLLALLGGFIIFRQKITKEKKDRGNSFRTSYAYSVSSLLLIFAVLPAFACYSSVGHMEMRLFTQFQLLEIFDSLDNSKKLQEFETAYICPQPKISSFKNFSKSSGHYYSLGLYPDFFLNTTMQVCGGIIDSSIETPPFFDRMFSLLSQPFLPLLKNTNLGGFIGEIWPPKATNEKDQLANLRELRWGHTPTSTSLYSTLPTRTLATPSNMSASEHAPETPTTYTVQINADYPYALSWKILSIEKVAWYLLMALVFLTWFIRIPRFIANKTVFLSYTIQSQFPMEAIFLSQNYAQPNNRLILGFPGQGKTPMASHIDTHDSRFLHFDLKTLPPNQWWPSLSMKLIQAKKENIQHVYLVVDHLECQWKNPAFNLKKLEFLEMLLHRHASTVHSEESLNSKSKKLIVEITGIECNPDAIRTKILPTPSS